VKVRLLFFAIVQMIFENSMGPLETQSQSSQGRQWKRQRNQTQSLVMSSQISDSATFRHIEVSSASQEVAQKEMYEIWTESTETQLFE